MSNPMTLAMALAWALRQGSARIDAQMLLLHAVQHDPYARAWLLSHDTQVLSPTQWQSFQDLLQRRMQGEPVAYLIGQQAFHALHLCVDERVLIPRPETEVLVEWALSCAAPNTALRILDLGTGSGAIALALKYARPHWDVHALDCSAAALAVAQANAQRLQLPVHWHQGHWLQSLQDSFDVIVSNPPYIADTDPHVPALRYEPRLALCSGADGLDAIRHIVSHASAHLRPGGYLLLEHGYDQASSVRDLLRQAGFAQVQSRHDLAGIERCSGGVRADME